MRKVARAVKVDYFDIFSFHMTQHFGKLAWHQLWFCSYLAHNESGFLAPCAKYKLYGQRATC